MAGGLPECGGGSMTETPSPDSRSGLGPGGLLEGRPLNTRIHPQRKCPTLKQKLKLMNKVF